MKRQLIATFLLFLAPFFFVACVSSILKESPPSFSQEIKVTAPAHPFQRTKASVYPTWKSQKSGNVISIVSDCDSQSANSLSQLHRIVEDSLTNIKVITEVGGFIDEKPSLQKSITAELDGADIEVVSVSFKRKNCGYISSLSGKIGQVQQDISFFEQFNKNLQFHE